MKKIISLILSVALFIGSLFILTVYSSVLSAEEVLLKVISTSESLDNVEFEKIQAVEMGDSTTSLKQESRRTVKEICGTNNFYLEVEEFANDVSGGKGYIYTVQEPDGVVVYISDGTDWNKDKIDNKAFDELNFENNGFSPVIEYLKETEVETVLKEERDGKAIFKLSGKLSGTEAEKTIQGIMSREAIESMKQQSTLFSDVDTDKVFSSLPPIKVEIIADAKDFTVIEVNFDMREMVEKIYQNLVDELTGEGNGFKVSITDASERIKVKARNSFDKIEVPEGIENAVESDFVM